MSEGTRPRPPSRPGSPQPDGAGQGWASLATLLSGMFVWGGAGYGLDRLIGITLFLPVGVLAGLAASVYLVYVRAAPPTS